MDRVFEPLMAARPPQSLLARIFGVDKGSGTALLFLILGLIGVATCLIFRGDRHIWALERE